MKKRLVSILLSSLLCTAMVGTTVFAADASLSDSTTGTDIEGDSETIQPIYNIVVPTKLTFGLDAFEQNGESQISSSDFYMVNKSNVNVKVDVALKVAGATDQTINFKTSADDVAHTGTDKDVWFAAIVPTTVTEKEGAAIDHMIDADKTLYKVTTTAETTGIVVSADTSANALALAETIDGTKFATGEAGLDATALQTKPVTSSGSFDYANKDDFTAITLGTDATTLTFALKGADYSLEYYTTKDAKSKAYTALAADKKGSAVYRFYGVINDAAVWADKDVKATATYSFIGLSDTNYATNTDADHKVVVDATSGSETYAHALVKTGSVVADKAPSIANTNVTYSKANGVTIPIDLGAGTLAATGIKDMKYGPAGNETNNGTEGTHYTLKDGNLEIKTGVFGANPGEKRSIVITMNDSNETVITLTVTMAN